MKRVDDIAKSNLSVSAKWLAVFMIRHQNRTGEVTATLSEIRVWTGLGTRTIQQGLNDLQEARFISVIAPFQHTPNSSAKFALRVGGAESAAPVAQNPQHLVSEKAKITDSLASAGAMYVSLSSPGISYSSVLENKELGQEGISNTRDAQGELISVDAPAWLTDLRTTPGYDLDAARERRLIERVDAAAISTQRLCEAATSIAAKWESYKWSPTNRRGYKRLDLTFFDWAKREGHNGQSQNGHHNGRYRAPGIDIPKAGTPEAHARWPAPAYDAP